MGRHVLGVSGVGCDLGVGARGAQPQGRVDRVVIGVDQIVSGAGVVGVAIEELLGDRSRPHVGGDDANALAQSQQRERIKRLCLRIVGVVCREFCHGECIGGVALGLGAIQIEVLHGVEVRLLALRGRLGLAGLTRRGEPCQRRERRFSIALVPDRMVVCHRFAPIGHGEAAIELLRLAEGRRG